MIDIYDGGVGKFLAFGSALERQVKTSVMLDDAAQLAANVLSAEFSDKVDQRAIVDPSLSHIYEWNAAGEPNTRLWQFKFTGKGRGRTLSFTFIPSRTQVPVKPRDPGPSGQQVQQRHVFAWKAMILEYGIPTTIRPKEAKALAIPVDDEGMRNGLIFLRKPLRLNNKTYHYLAFTRLWQTWWEAGGAIETFNSRVQPILEKAWTESDLKKVGITGGRSMKKTLSFDVSPVAGDAIAAEYLRAIGMKYKRGAV